MIEKLFLKEVCAKNDITAFLQADVNWFLNKQALSLYMFLKKFYENYNKLPSVQELVAMDKGSILLDVPDTNILPYIIDNLQERHKKALLYTDLYNIFEHSDNDPYSEIIDNIQALLIKNSIFRNESEELLLGGDIIPEENLCKKTLGLGKFDIVNKGMSPTELMIIGGHRGSGKSILALNIALHNFRINKESTAFLSLEMRKEEVLSRMDAIISGVPAMDILNRSISLGDTKKILKARSQVFKDTHSKEYDNFCLLLDKSNNMIEINKAYTAIPHKEKKFFVIDCPAASLGKIGYYLTKLKKQNNITMAIVDYLNIIVDSGSSDLYDWKSQAVKSNSLKNLARQLDIKVIAPFQTSIEGQVKYSKAIEDPVDYSIIFSKKDSSSSIINLTTSKIRNGTHLKFNLKFDPKSLLISSLQEENNESLT